MTTEPHPFELVPRHFEKPQGWGDLVRTPDVTEARRSHKSSETDTEPALAFACPGITLEEGTCAVTGCSLRLTKSGEFRDGICLANQGDAL